MLDGFREIEEGALIAEGASKAGVTRRAALASIGGAAVGLAAVGLPRTAQAAVPGDGPEDDNRPHVVVIGGGIAGVATAWLLDGVCKVTVLESEEYLGGHANSIQLNVNGTLGVVDVGAQYFGPRSHPLYWNLVTRVLKRPIVPAPMNITLGRAGRTPLLVSPDTNRLNPLFDFDNTPALLALEAFTRKGKEIEERGDWTTTAEEFIESLHPILPPWTARRMKDELIYPLVASMFGVTVPHAKQMSAHAVVAFVIRGLGEGFLAPYDYYNVVAGLGSVVYAMRNSTPGMRTHTSAPATRLSRLDDKYVVEDGKGGVHLADHVVLALPPYAAGPLVGQLAGTDRIVSTYRRFHYNPVRVAIHTDPMYMPAKRSHWSGFNAVSDGGDYCEGTMWYGAFREQNVFKSWVTYREELPREIVASVDFRHAHETPDFARAQAALYGYQGQGNLWFAGSHMTDVVSQESALVSAVRIAEQLAPASKNLARLRNA
jgi:predicted NAD/FAD-binding protein